MAVGPRRYRSHAAHRGLVEGQSAEAPNLFWMCAGKMSAQSGAIQAAFPVQSNRRFQSIPVTCSGRAAFGGSNGAAPQQGYQGNGVTAGLHSKADLWRNPHRKPGRDPLRSFAKFRFGQIDCNPCPNVNLRRKDIHRR